MIVSQAKKGRILILSLSDLSRDPRVYRQIESLCKFYEVHTAGKVKSGIEDTFFNLGTMTSAGYGAALLRVKHQIYGIVRRIVLFLDRLLKLPSLKESILLHNPSFARFISVASTSEYDLVLANDLSSLSLAMKVRGRAKILYDAHEYSAGQSSEARWLRIERPYVCFLLSKYICSADVVTTVCEGIADQYARDFDIPKPFVIMNASAFSDLAPRNRDDGLVRIVHHGIATRARAIDVMIRAVELLDERFVMDLYLVGSDEKYIDELRKAGKRSGRIRILEPVAMHELPKTLNEYDIGMYILPPTSFNQLHALPNKIFEFLQARLAVAVGPSPEMAKLVKDFGLGVVSNDFSAETMACTIAGLDTAAISSFKMNAHRYARELSAESEMNKLGKIVGALI